MRSTSPIAFFKKSSWALALGSLLFVVSAAHAAVDTWTGGGANNNWSTGAIWSADRHAGTQRHLANFDNVVGIHQKLCNVDISTSIPGIKRRERFHGHH